MEFKYPKNETVWCRYCDRHGSVRFFLTSKEARDYYYLYEVTNEGIKKLGKARTPPEIEKKYEVHRKCAEL